jgi:hypothetical protein
VLQSRGDLFRVPALFKPLPKRRFQANDGTPGKAPDAPVAQLDRASDYESEGREFESLRARHFPCMTGIFCGGLRCGE